MYDKIKNEDIINFFDYSQEFSPCYKMIIHDMGFSEKEDILSRKLLNDLILKKTNYKLENVLKGIIFDLNQKSKLIFFGGGPDSNNLLKYLKRDHLLENLSNNFYIIAIDGSINLLKNFNIIPNIVFSDLDGLKLKNVIKPAFSNTYFIIHAHGNNINLIKKYSNFIVNHQKIVSSTQNDSKYPTLNYGGFTDGDRALYFYKNLVKKSNQVYLIGYDFGNIVGAHSKPNFTSNFVANELKLKKLEIAIKLINRIANYYENINILEMDYSSNLKNINKINFESEKRFREVFL